MNGRMLRLNKLSAQIRMLLQKHGLRQIDEAYMRSLSHEDLMKLSTKLLSDLKEAHERLDQNPSNSSRPPSSQAPWISNESAEDDEDDEEAGQGEKEQLDELLRAKERSEATEPEEDGAESAQEAAPAQTDAEEPARKAGKQKGAPGHGRTQQLAVTDTVHHRPGSCEICGREAQESSAHKPWTGYYTLDVKVGDGDTLGMQVTNTKHLFYELTCECGHCTREVPHRCEDDALWEQVQLSEWRLVGETLCALIIALSYRSRMSRARVKEFLHDWLGLKLSLGTLQRCIEEAARAAAPVEDQLVAEIVSSDLLHADETPHKEHGEALWLWVFVSAITVLFLVGYRSREILDNLLGEAYGGWLMSDGYQNYRTYKNRLRCWAHLLRKAKGLEDSLVQEARRFGTQTTELLEMLMEAIYRAREGPGTNLAPQYQGRLDAYRAVCERAKESSHEKTRALAVEFLNDWEAIFRVLENPHWPLTNNEAERALRHWVILRRISYGTRTMVGSRSFALLASIIDTCRKRGVSPWPYLAEVIACGRRGQEAPVLPAPA
jgi:transposase